MAHGRQTGPQARRWIIFGARPGAEHVESEAREVELPAASAPPAHLETLAALVLSIAAVATAWSAYQSTRWSGEMVTLFNEAASLRAESVRADNLAGQATVADVTIAADWASAELSNNEVLAAALRERMTPELSAAMAQWLGTWHTEQPLPPGSPFTDGRYEARGSVRATELGALADARFSDGRRANQRGDNYVLTGVLFALALFFAGISTRMQDQGRMTQMVYGAAIVMVIGIMLLILQPKSVGV